MAKCIVFEIRNHNSNVSIIKTLPICCKYIFVILICIYMLITIFCMVEVFAGNCVFKPFYVAVKNVEKRWQTMCILQYSFN